MEGLLFAASFAAIAFFKTRGLLPGLGTANEYIARDESLHCSFAAECLYKTHVVNKLPVDRVHEIVSEAIAIEDQFITSALPVKLIGMSADDMMQYTRFCANRLLVALGVPPLYEGATCPWEWVQLIGVQGSTNFFEKRVADYAKSSLKRMNGDLYRRRVLIVVYVHGSLTDVRGGGGGDRQSLAVTFRYFFFFFFLRLLLVLLCGGCFSSLSAASSLVRMRSTSTSIRACDTLSSS